MCFDLKKKISLQADIMPTYFFWHVVIISRSILLYKCPLKSYILFNIEKSGLFLWNMSILHYIHGFTASYWGQITSYEAEIFLGALQPVCLVYQFLICWQNCLNSEFEHDKFLKKP